MALVFIVGMHSDIKTTEIVIQSINLYQTINSHNPIASTFHILSLMHIEKLEQ